jgi:hypothetical protein
VANELSWRYTDNDATLYVTIRNSSRQYYNTDTPDWESLAIANWSDYVVSLTETPSSSYFYIGDMPAINNGWYWVDVFEQPGATPDIGDTLVASILAYWNNIEFLPSDSNVATISKSDESSEILKALMEGTPHGAVNDASPSETLFETNLVQSADDYYNGAFVLFYTGTLSGQSRLIDDYDGTNKSITVSEAFTSTPSDEDKFVILGRGA